MRTTVDLDASLLRQARKCALETRRTLSEVIAEALRAGLAASTGPVAPIDLPVIASLGPAPTREALRAALLEDDLRHYHPHLGRPAVNDGPG
jgi:hypothetical protein